MKRGAESIAFLDRAKFAKYIEVIVNENFH